MIQLDDEALDKVMIIGLKNDYKLINKGIRNIKNLLQKGKADTSAYNDLEYEKKLLKSLKKVLKYKMPIYEYEQFIKENK